MREKAVGERWRKLGAKSNCIVTCSGGTSVGGSTNTGDVKACVAFVYKTCGEGNYRMYYGNGGHEAEHAQIMLQYDIQVPVGL